MTRPFIADFNISRFFVSITIVGVYDLTDLKFHFNKAKLVQSEEKITDKYWKFITGYERLMIMRRYNLDEQEVDEWIAKNQVSFQSRLARHKDAVALAQFGKVQNVLSDAQHSALLLNLQNKRSVRTQGVSSKIAQTYEAIGTEFYDYLRDLIRNGLPKSQTGTALIQRTVDLNGKLLYQHLSKGVSLSYEALKKANLNIWEKGKFAVFDLETLGGFDRGHQWLDAITEFSFGIADESGEIGAHYGSIVGIDATWHRRFMEIIQKYETGGEISDREAVILKRLAKTGNKKTIYRQVEGMPGVYEYVSFAGDSDIKEMNVRDMRRGADALMEIYDAQKSTLVTYRDSHMLAWEKRFLEGLHAIQSQDLTIVGHNSAAFDAPMLERFIEGGFLSENASKVLRDLGLSPAKWKNRNFDTLAAIRAAGLDWQRLYAGADDKKILKEHGLTHFTLEALTRKYVPGYYEGKTPHVSRTDIGANAKLLVKSDLFRPQASAYLYGGKGPKMHSITANGSMLYYAKEGIGGNGTWGASFVEDEFSGSLRTFDGFKVEDGVVEKELFGQYGFQKNVSYTLESIYGHEMSQAWQNAIKDTHPELLSREIVTATFRPVANSESFKALSPVTLVGTRESVERQIGQSLLLTAKHEGSGWSMLKDADIVDAMREIEFDPQSGKLRRWDATVKSQIEESTRKIENEAAARARREMSIAKEEKLLSFFDDMDRFVTQTVPNGRYADDGEARRAFLLTVRQKSMLAARGVAERDLSHADAELVKTYQEYFGWRDKQSGEWRVYRETVDAALNSGAYASSMRQTMRTLIDAAKRRGGNDRALRNFYFRAYYTGLQSYLAEEAGGMDAVTNTQPMRIRGLESHKFDIDLSEYAKSREIKPAGEADSIITINLEAGNHGLAQKLIQARGYTEEISDTDKIKEIRRFSEFLAKNGVIEPIEVDPQKETVETATQRLLNSLTAARANDPMAGRLLNAKFQNVAVSSQMEAMGLTQDRVAAILNEIDQSLPTVRTLDKATLENETHRIVERVLFDRVTEEELLALGHTKKQLANLLEARSMRMQDTKKFMREFFGQLMDAGAGIFYDEKRKEVFLHAADAQVKLENLPRDVMEDGRFYTQIGNMKVASPIGVYGSEYRALSFRTLIGKAHDNVYWMRTAIQRGAAEGSLAQQAQSVLGVFAKTLRESASVMKGDFQDARSEGFFATQDIIPRLQDLYRSGTFDGIVFEKNDAFLELLRSDRPLDPEQLTYKARGLITLNMKRILQALAAGDGRMKSFVDRFSWDNKEITDFVGTFDNQSHFGDVYGTAKRGVHQQVSRALRFNADSVRERISERVLRDVTIGRSLHTSVELARAKYKLQGVGFQTESAIRVNRLSLRTKDLRDLVASAGGYSAYVDEILNGLHLEEGAALGSPEIMDHVFGVRASIQKIHLSRIAEINLETIDEIDRKRRIAPRLKIGADGSITFEYANGVFVHRGEELLSVKGYGETAAPVKAKEQGMLRFGVFSKTGGLLMDEGSIQRTLNTDAARRNVLASANPLQTAYEILSDTYEFDYYLKPFDANPYRKMSEGAVEKNMTRFLVGGLGTHRDERVAETLKALGLGDLLFQVPDREYIEALSAREIKDTALGALLEKKNGRVMRSQEVADIVGRNFGSLSDFQKALEEERVAPMQALRRILADNGLEEADAVHFISNNFASEAKHKDPAGAIRRIADQLMEKYDQDAMKVQGVLHGAIKGLQVVDGALVAPNGEIDLKALESLARAEGLDTRRQIGGIEADLAQTTLTAMDNHDRITYLVQGDSYGKGMKFTDRNLQMLEWERYDAANLSRVRAALEPDVFQKAFAHVLDGEGNLKKEYQNQPIAKSIGAQIRRAMYTPPGDTLLMREGEIDRRIQTELSNKGVATEGLLEALRQKNIPSIGKRAAEDRYAVMTGILARAWNSGRSGYSLDDMQHKAGFEVQKLRSLITSTGANQGLDETLFGRKMLLDLHLNELGENQLYASISERYLALPYTPVSWMDPEHTQEAKTLYQQKVALLKRQSENYAAAKRGGVAAQEQERIFSAMRKTVGDIKHQISVSVTAKKQGLARLGEAQLADAGRFQAGGIQLFGNEAAAYYRDLEFDGINLVKEAARAGGAEYDATFVGREFLSRVYNQEYLDRLGLTQEEVFAHLKRRGTLAINVREPADYVKSASVSALYLSDSLAGNIALNTAALFESKKGDYDGDTVGVKVLKGAAYVRDKKGDETLQDITYDLYKLLEDKGRVRLTDETQQMFADAVASMHYNAAVYNKKYRQQPDHVLRDSLDLSVAKEYAIDGILRPQRALEPSEAKRMQSLFENLNLLPADFKSLDELKKAGLQQIERMGINEAEREEYKAALHYGIGAELDKIDAVAKQRKASAGEANHYLYQHRRLIDIVSGYEHSGISQDERAAMQKVALAIQEGFLSPKNESSADVEMLDRFKLALSDMMGYRGRPDGTAMQEFLLNQMDLKHRKEMQKLPWVEKEEDLEPAVRRAVQTFASFGERTRLSGAERAYFAQGILTRGVAEDSPLLFVGSDIDSIDRETDILDRAIRSMEVESPLKRTVLAEPNALYSGEEVQRTFKLNRSLQEDNEMTVLIRSAGKKMASARVSGKQLAFGAVGLAGAVMLAGFTGGNPAVPAETQAQNSGEAETYQIPKLSDSNLSRMRRGPQQGYVININAQTDQGRQYATDAIQQALADGFGTTNINVAMNIHASGQVNAVQVARMLELAIQ